MFKIIAIQDNDMLVKYASACSAHPRDGWFAYAMIDVSSGEPMGFAQFDITDGCGVISDLREAEGNSDFEAMFILGRSTMNFIDLCGAHEAYAEANAADESLIKAIGFKHIDDGRYYCNMTGMFDGNCSHH